MRFPQEIVVQTFLPTYRALLARSLSRRGLSQERIAALLSLSQAQVSKYLAEKVELEPLLADDPRVAETVDEVARGLDEGTLDSVGALARSLVLGQRLEDRGPLCRLHERVMPELEGTGCDACIDPASLVMREHEVLTTLRLALRRLGSMRGLARWVPHVGSNLAQARAGAKGVWDVAALPGRIDSVGDAVRIASEPAFGGSQHVATMVLAVAEVHPQLLAAMNVAHRPELLDLAQRAGYVALEFDGAYDGRRERVVQALRGASGRGPPDLLYHVGAFGIEPVAYLVGRDALDVVDRMAKLLSGAGPRPGSSESP